MSRLALSGFLGFVALLSVSAVAPPAASRPDTRARMKDLYGVDFDTLSDEQARQLDQRISRNYLDRRWLYEVVTERANIELMLNDPYWARFDFRSDYPFQKSNRNQIDARSQLGRSGWCREPGTPLLPAASSRGKAVDDYRRPGQRNDSGH
jgi:hypothetical protein